MIKIAKKDSFEGFESDIMSSLGLEGSEATDDVSVAAGDADDGAGVADQTDDNLTDAPPAVSVTPRSGTQDWGSWSHEGNNINLDLTLPAGSRAKDCTIDVSKEGVLRVESQGAPLLVGKFALPVDRAELAWLMEEQDDGTKLLSIELPMLPIDTSKRVTAVNCMFDESLEVNGQTCLVPGLSSVGGRHV